MKDLELMSISLTELTSEDMVSTNGGDSSNYWYATASEAAAGVANFFDGVATGFKDGLNSWGNFL